MPDKNSNSEKLKTIITVKLTPRSSRNEITGMMENGIIKIRLTAPPVEGKANEALIKFLSGILKINEANIEIKSGATSRTKMISILGVGEEELQNRLLGI